jgi:hypothetical protein
VSARVCAELACVLKGGAGGAGSKDWLCCTEQPAA